MHYHVNSIRGGMRMNKYKLKSITADGIPAMVDLLIERQNHESKVYPFLKNTCLNAKYITDILEELLANSKVIEGWGHFLMRN